MRDVTYIVYLADELELPCGVFDTVTDCARYIPCSRDEVYDSIKFGDTIHGYKIDSVNLDVYIP